MILAPIIHLSLWNAIYRHKSVIAAFKDQLVDKDEKTRVIIIRGIRKRI